MNILILMISDLLSVQQDYQETAFNSLTYFSIWQVWSTKKVPNYIYWMS